MKELNEMMEFDCPVAVDNNGEVTRSSEHAPETYWSMSADDSDAEMLAYLNSQGWDVLNGYSGQDRYSGPIMHASEYVGGGLERDILAEPGVYVTLYVEDIDDDPMEGDNAVGWIVARKLSIMDKIGENNERLL
jgi:hypothetical protein